MNDVSKILDEMRRFALQDGWNRFRLARESGLSERALRNLYKKDFNPTAGTIMACQAVIKKYSKSKKR